MPGSLDWKDSLFVPQSVSSARLDTVLSFVPAFSLIDLLEQLVCF